MSVHPDDLHELVRSIQRDLQTTQKSLARLKEMLTALKLPAPKKHECPRCGVDLPNEQDLLWHLVNIHSDPRAAEKLGVMV